MASNVVMVKFPILVAVTFVAALACQLQIAVAIRPDPPSNSDSQITGSLRLPARSSAGLIIEVLDHQYYTKDDSSGWGHAINSDWKLHAQSLTNKHPPPPGANPPHNFKFHAQGLINAHPPPPADLTHTP